MSATVEDHPHPLRGSDVAVLLLVIVALGKLKWIGHATIQPDRVTLRGEPDSIETLARFTIDLAVEASRRDEELVQLQRQHYGELTIRELLTASTTATWPSSRPLSRSTPAASRSRRS